MLALHRVYTFEMTLSGLVDKIECIMDERSLLLYWHIYIVSYNLHEPSDDVTWCGLSDN